jgi:hypothetical protein
MARSKIIDKLNGARKDHLVAVADCVGKCKLCSDWHRILMLRSVNEITSREARGCEMIVQVHADEVEEQKLAVEVCFSHTRYPLYR